MDGSSDSPDGLNQANVMFQHFMEKMKDPRAQPLVVRTRDFLARYEEGRPAPGPERAEWDKSKVQNFLLWMEGAIRQSNVWKGCTEEEMEHSAEGIEKYVTTKLHETIFGSDPLDAERDVFIAAKMGALRGPLRPEHLDIPDAMRDEHHIALAQKELLKMDQYKAPRDKLVCILNSCKVVSDLCAKAKGQGADDLMPLLSYVTIKGAPERLFANLHYIQRFRSEKRLAFGESAYYFSTMCAVASFVETLNAEQLSMPRDEFVRVMASAGLMAPDVEGGPDGSGGDREAPLIALDSGPADGDQAAPPERASARPAPPAIIAPAEPDAPVPRPGDAPGETSAWRGRSAVASPATAPGGTSSGGEAQMPAQGGAAGAGGTAGAHGQPAPRVPFIPPPPPPPYGPVAPHSHPPPLGDPPPRAKASGVPSALGKAPGAAMGEVEGPEAAARGRVASSMGTSVRPPSLAELEEEGVGLVLDAEQAGELRAHRFLYMGADDLTVADVRLLLSLYKGLVIKHEALCRAVEKRREEWLEHPRT